MERDARLPEAAAQYEAAIDEAYGSGATRVLAEALRRLAVLRYQQNDPDAARALCHRSAEVAFESSNDVLAAEALNTLAGVDLQTGALDQARENYERALTLGGHDRELAARVEQNLGILDNIHGDLTGAWSHYARSLEACEAAGDAHGCALAYHNLGMVSADRGELDEAEDYFARSRAIAEASGDLQLQGLCLMNSAEVDLDRQCYEQARAHAEEALVIFDRLGVLGLKAAAYRMIGMVYRETGRPALATSRLRVAMELASEAKSLLVEAEAARELAVLCQAMGRNQEALSLLNAAHRLFDQLDARTDLVNVRGRRTALENTYLAVVRDWGESLESTDNYTHGHCERVGAYAEAVARALGLAEEDFTTIRIGAWLHDLGKVRVPHEILNKPGPLTQDEFELMKMHTVWGAELLEDVAFPWDIKPIIRWHHERYDGTGYPDRLKGDEVPLHAQIIGIADVFDALTTTRSYREAMSTDTAIDEIERCRHWWREDVVEAFLHSAGMMQETLS
jgi:putative nucleotidyltransferase with HDIG domain